MGKISKKTAGAAIARKYPDFDCRSIERIGEGMDSVAFLVNDEIVFRFPKNAGTRRNLLKEVAILPELTGRVRVRIPRFDYVGEGGEFVGYEMIRGRELTRELFAELSPTGRERLIAQISGFIRDVHSQPLAALSGSGVETVDYRDEYAESLAEIRRRVFELLSDAEKRFIVAQFDAYLSNAANFGFEPVLLHNDLSGDHIFIDPETGDIAGIIDFGDIAVGDGDYDLMYLLDDFGEEFVRSVLEHESREDAAALFDKLYFWCLADTLQMMAHYAETESPAKALTLRPELGVSIEAIRRRERERSN